MPRHGLRRVQRGGRLDLVDINAVAKALGIDDARGDLRRNGLIFIRTGKLRIERAAVACFPRSAPRAVRRRE